MAEQNEGKPSTINDDQDSCLKEWMKKNGFSVSEETYTKLKTHGFVTMYVHLQSHQQNIKNILLSDTNDYQINRNDLKQCTVQEMKEYCQKEQMDIRIADRSKLQRAVELLTNKSRIINPEDIEILKCIDGRIKEFHRNINELEGKQKAIEQQHKSMEMAINLGFDALFKKLECRKKLIMKQLKAIINERRDAVSSSLDTCNANIREANTLREETQNLIETAIHMNELNDRTMKLMENQRKITKIINQSNEMNEEHQYTAKINFVLDTKKAAIMISKLGMFTEAKHRIDSEILSERDKLNLLDLIEARFNGKVKLSLLFRMSDHGESTKKFHELCDNKGATLTIIKSKKFDHIFGGFTSASWNNCRPANPVKDISSFLYLLSSNFGDELEHKPQIFPVCSDEGGVLYDSSCGPAFGSRLNYTLAIRANGNGYVCNQNPDFQIVGNALCGGETFETERKKYNFEIEDYEVFRLATKKRKMKKESEMTWRQFLQQTAGSQD